MRLLLLVAAVVSAMFAVRYGARLFAQEPGFVFAVDFEVFYRAAQAWVSGASSYCVDCAYGASGGVYHPFLNPPFFMFVLWPLSFLSVEAARWAFLLVQLVGWAAVLVWAGRRLLVTPNRTYRIAALVLIPLPFLMNTVFVGQTGILFSTAMLLGALLLASQPLLAGMAFALLAAKPSLALMVPVLLIAGRQWRVLISMAVTLVVLSVAATAVWGFESWVQWLQAMESHQQMLQQVEIPGPFQRQLISVYSGVRTLGGSVGLAGGMQMAAAFAAALVLARAAWRAPTAPTTRALFFVCSLIATPYVLLYDAVILSVVVLLVMDHAVMSAPKSSLRSAMMVLLFCPLLVPQLQPLGVPMGMVMLLAALLGCHYLGRR